MAASVLRCFGASVLRCFGASVACWCVGCGMWDVGCWTTRTKKVAKNPENDGVKASARHGPTRPDQGGGRAASGSTGEPPGPPLRSAELGSAGVALTTVAGGIINPDACRARIGAVRSSFQGGVIRQSSPQSHPWALTNTDTACRRAARYLRHRQIQDSVQNTYLCSNGHIHRIPAS